MKAFRQFSLFILMMSLLSSLSFAAVSNTGEEITLDSIGNHILTQQAAPPPQQQGPCAFLYAPSEDDDPAFRAEIAAITGSTVDYYDARAGTPTLGDLAPYCCVFTWTNFSYADNTAFGDVLADFVDQGGAVVLGAFCAYTDGAYLSGRIMTSGYCPVTGGSNHFTTSSYAGDGTSVIYDGVTAFASQFRDILTLQGSGIQDGTYDDGETAHAYRPDFAVVYSNGAGGATLGNTGDWALLITNACEALASEPPAPTPIPTLNEWGMIIFSLLIAGSAVFLMRKTTMRL